MGPFDPAGLPGAGPLLAVTPIGVVAIQAASPTLEVSHLSIAPSEPTAKRPRMDKDTQISLHRSKMGRVDKMIRSGRFEDLYRELKAVAPSTRSEYFMIEAGRKVGPQEIEDLAKQLGIISQR